MTNALKHACASEVHLELEPNPDGFVILFRDNGCGIREMKVSKGYGLKNMASRAEQINCEVQVGTPRSGTGTEVRFIGKLPKHGRRNGVVKRFLNKTTTL